MNEAIAALVRRHDPDRFLTALFAPPERRDALLTLYAFNHELARAREVASVVSPGDAVVADFDTISVLYGSFFSDNVKLLVLDRKSVV